MLKLMYLYNIGTIFFIYKLVYYKFHYGELTHSNCPNSAK